MMILMRDLNSKDLMKIMTLTSQVEGHHADEVEWIEVASIDLTEAEVDS